MRMRDNNNLAHDVFESLSRDSVCGLRCIGGLSGLIINFLGVLECSDHNLGLFMQINKVLSLTSYFHRFVAVICLF